ncbi:MAG: tRNA dihydrouridine synthase DusB [Gammaproteobacteria bacterium]|nr:tRNA dihydrouridine synthase DusB [Gammaproteobacteria bacterium]NNC97495.1 tRNA dihydrouridine synthase DusB [Gammaproteobacteria bacterium]NNM13589.1 tRNA dihydrouridine synthase DusB [Gammaproteobacteria bacterium]
MHPVTIGPYTFANNLALAPMAGVTDRPFRMLCRKYGAGMAASEMLTSDVRLWHTRKSRLRMDHSGEPAPRIVQIAGGDAEMMATAAQMNVEHGAQIIDINMGCPAKKVCNKAAGSALMQNEALVAQILHATVQAVDVPVTLKIRTGWNRANKNALNIAKIAEDSGIQSLAIHGRTRADKYQGEAEYETIRAIKQQLSIPVFANGDVDNPVKALQVLHLTGADGLMIGRAAQGKPWVFNEIAHYLENKTILRPLAIQKQRAIMCGHLSDLHRFYGDQQGVRIARKHLGWYCKGASGLAENIQPLLENWRKQIVRADCIKSQLNLVQNMFDALEETLGTSNNELAA